MAFPQWVPGDMLGINIPADIDALREGGARFLTEVFQASGVLAADNRVTEIKQSSEVSGGGTGRKLALSVSYQKQLPGLHQDLFIKFSRDFADGARDRWRHMMEAEVRLASLSQLPGFPIVVPKCYFADYHPATGTAILITERIAFDNGPIEPLYGKCLDYELPQPLQHYQAIIKALAKLAGTHQAGRLHGNVAHLFPFNRSECVARDPIPYSAIRLQNRVARYAQFAAEFPQLLPQNITTPAFIAQLMETVPRFVEHENAIKQFLYSKREFVALCHWNANIDNAWFWRNARGEIECGLFDWGLAGQMNVALALYGCLSGAEPELWNDHLDTLLT